MTEFHSILTTDCVR